MKQLISYRFYELGAKLHGLLGAENGTRVADMFVPLSEAQTLLDSFIKGDILALTTSKTDAAKLLAKIGNIFDRYFIDPTTKQLMPREGEDHIDVHEQAILRGLVEKFEHALAAELNHAPTYVADKCGIYSTFDLAENAKEIFAENLQRIIPEASQNEFCTAGRALVFGLGTAAIMHALRAIEITLRGYYEMHAGGTSAKTERNYTTYIKKLATLADEEAQTPKPDKRIIQMLMQIKEHYRTPMLSSDTTYSTVEAMQLFNMGSAVISMMAEAMMHNNLAAVENACKSLSALDADGEDNDHSSTTRKAG